MKKLLYILVILLISSCKNYLDIVPDNVATIESAFTLRSAAEKYLFTCYFWVPDAMNLSTDPAAGYWGGEFWGKDPTINTEGFNYGKGDIGITSPRLNFWSGLRGGRGMFKGLRDCNIFLENIGKVPDISMDEREKWIAEVKFLKAYYHFVLLRMYGPIPLIKESLPISATLQDIRQPRNTVDECFEYIVSLIDEAIPNLPFAIIDMEQENGRITAAIAASIKAKILVTAASPLFNGNTNYASLKNHDGTVLFNQVYDAEKWRLAMDASKEAIDMCHQANISIYKHLPVSGDITTGELSDTTVYQLSVRRSLTERWNTETIWANPNYTVPQGLLTPVLWNPTLNFSGFGVINGLHGPSLGFVEKFYTDKGLPIDEDQTWMYADRYKLQVSGEAEKHNLITNYTTVKLHFNRENRFYACLGFDGGVWYGQGKYTDTDNWSLSARLGGNAGHISDKANTPTGYYAKKRIHFQNIVPTNTTYSVVWYPSMIMRLADLYLLYAESLNEYSGPSETVYQYLNLIRERAGVPTVQSSWSTYSTNPEKYLNKDGLRSIIQREREIELCFESQTFWDMRRWLRAEEEFSKPITGWTLQRADAESYYQPVVLFEPKFLKRNYLDPIPENQILNNPALVQNMGW